MMKLVAALALAAAVLVTVALSGVGRPDDARGEAAPRPRTDVVTVTGTGKIDTVPDRAEASFGVVTRAETAERAVEDNAEKMNAVIAALRDAGVAEKDIRTQELALNPRFEKDRGIVGYDASNTVVASSALDTLGAALDAAVAAGANRSYGLMLARSDRDDLYRDALAAAVDDARAKAEALADAGAFDVGDVVRVEEGGGAMPMYEADAGAFAPMEQRTPLMPGTQEIQASVSVSFAIR
jgi:uncharacterized protein